MPNNPYDQTVATVDAPTQPIATNPYDATVKDLGADTEIKMRRSMADAADVSPDTAAESRRLSLKLGVPPAVIQRDLPAYQKQGQLAQPYQAMQAQTPKLAAWLQTPENAAVAKDDLEHLGLLEWLVTMPSRAVAQTVNEQRYGALRSASIYRDLTQAEHDQLESYRYQMHADGALGAGNSWFKGALAKGIQLGATLTIPETLPTLFGTVVGAAGGAAVGTVLEPGGGTIAGAYAGARLGARAGYTEGLAKSAFQTEAGASYDSFQDFRDEYGRPLDPAVAKMAALSVGAINAALMTGGGAVIAHSLGVGVEKLGGKFTQSAVQTALKNPTVRAALADAMKSYAATLAEGTGLMVGMAGVRILGGEIAKTVANETQAAAPDMTGWDARPDGSPKGEGFFGALQRPDGGVMSEYSVGVPINGKETDVPTLVPTLTPEEVQSVLALKPGEQPSPAIIAKAAAFAQERQAAGKPVYAQKGEQQLGALPDVKRAENKPISFAHRSPADVGHELAQAASEALQSFALVGAAGPAMGLMGDLARAHAATRNVDFFTALGEGVTESKTVQRMPEAAQHFLESATKDGPIEKVYAPIETWAQYWQDKGVDPAEMAAEVTGSRDAYDRAARTGEDLEIPTARYATKLAGTEHNAFFANELRLAPGEMNTREAQAFLEAQSQAPEAPAAAGPSPVRADITQQLEAAGVPRATADAYAALHESVFANLGERAGVAPEELYRRYGLTIDRPGEASVTATLPTNAAAGLDFEKQTAPLTADEVRALDRRQAQNAPPGGVDRRAPLSTDPNAPENQPINAMENIGAAATKMIAEDPTLLARAGEMRRSAMAAPEQQAAAQFAFYEGTNEAPVAKYWIPTETGVTQATAEKLTELGIPIPETPPDTGERLNGDQLRQRMLDARAARAQTATHDTGPTGGGAPTDQGRRPAIRSIAESSPQSRRESPKQQTARKEAHYNEVFGAVLDAAKHLDPAVDEAALRKEFNDRVEFLEAGEEAYRGEGHDPRALLQAIAGYGGISLKAEQSDIGGGYTGEIKWLRESDALGPFGSYAGVRGVFQALERGSRGLARTGLALDDMARMLSQDPAFGISDPNDLLAALADIARLNTNATRGGTFPGTDELARRAGVNPRVAWWKGPDETDLGQKLALFDEEPPAPETNAAGEQQPALPGAEGVRSTENPTPAMEAPFALTSETSKAKGKQDTLFQSAYHGSAHEFDEFSLHAIGTGEGAQAYGWGLYFASSREVAEGYRRRLAADKGRSRIWRDSAGKEVDIHALANGAKSGDPRSLAASFLRQEPSVEEALRFARTLKPENFTGGEGEQQAILSGLEQFQSEGLKKTEGGRLYTVDIPEDGDYLDWDKPIAEQSPKVKAALEQLGVRVDDAAKFPSPGEAMRLIDDAIHSGGRFPVGGERLQRMRDGYQLALDARTGGDDAAFNQWWAQNAIIVSPLADRQLAPMTGEDAYRAVQRNALQREREQLRASAPGRAVGSMDAGAKAASEALADAGIAGIRYLDGFSRSSGAGTSNYVLFDDKLVKVTEYSQRAQRSPEPAPRRGPVTTVEALRAQGFDTSRPLYHQTSEENAPKIKAEGFDLTKARARLSDEQVPDGVFLKPTPADIGVGASGAPGDKAVQMPVYVRLGNVQTFTDRAQLERRLSVDPHYAELVKDARAYDQAQSKVFDEKWEQLRKLDTVNRDEHLAHKADLEIDQFLEDWKAGNVERATLARARATELLRAEGVDTVVIKTDAGSLGRKTETIIAIGGDQIADAQAGQERVLFQPQQNERRGAIRFGADRQMNISLFARADLSTFLHESGHFFLEVLRDLANAPDASDQIKGDMATLDRFLIDEDNRTGTIDEAGHEKFARSFEAYLMKGEAPSLELRSTFARFRAWLTGVYRSLKNLKVDLSPEITGVMDRLVASDGAIADAQAAGRMEPMFTDAASAGMSEREFSLYRATVADASRDAQEGLQTKLLADVQREQTAEWKNRREDIRGQVEREIHLRPEYQALTAIQRGTYPNGEPLVTGEEPKPLKLDRKAIVDEFGKDRLKRLPRPYVYTSEGGQSPAAVAELFGFKGADELLTALETAGNMTRRIEAETDKRMIAEHGSMLLDGSLGEKAQAAVANESRDRVVRAEMRALVNLKRLVAPHVQDATRAAMSERAYERRWFEAEAKLRVAIAEGHKQVEIDELQNEVDNLKRKAAGGPAIIKGAIPPADVIASAARTRIAGTRIRDMRPEVFWSAARKASGQAVDAAARQDFDRAILAQQQQLLNLALYREASKAIDDADARARQAKDLNRPAAQQRLGKAGAGFREQVNGILDRYEFAAVSGKELAKRGELRRWVAAMEGEGYSVELPEEVLSEARRINYSELTYDELVGVTDGLQQIVHLARLTLRRLQNAAAEDYAATRDGIVSGINAHGVKRQVPLETLPKDRTARTFETFVASHVKLAEFAAQLDGYKDGGPLWDAIMRPVNEAATEQERMKIAAAKTMREILRTHYTGRELAHLHDPLFIPAINDALSKEARLAVALNWGNEGNRQRLMENVARKWNAGQVQAILDTLDERDLRFVQQSIDYINSFWPAIEAKQKRVFGVAPEKVDAASWAHSQYGEQKGGYYPIAYDGRLSVRQGNIIDADSSSLQKHANYAYATTKRGYTKAREERVNAPVLLELGVMGRHVEGVIHDLTHHEMLIDVGRLLGDRKVQGAITSRVGDIGYRQIKGALLDVALGTRHASTTIDRGVNFIRSGATIAGIGWNTITALKHLAGVFNGAARVGPSWVAKAGISVFRDASTMEWSGAWVNEKSDMMKLRSATFDRDISNLRQELGKAGGWFDDILRTVTADKLQREDIIKSYGALISSSIKLASLPTWIGMYEKALAGGEPDAKAVAMADQAVLDAHGGGQIKDLATVQRGSETAKLFTTFYTYGNILFNQTRRAVGETNFRRAGSVGQMATNLALLYVMPAIFTTGLQAAFGKMSKKDNPVLAVGKEILSEAFNTMVFLRELGGAGEAIYSHVTGEPPGPGERDYTGPVGVRAIGDVYKLVQASIAKHPHLATIARSAEDIGGVIFHLPVAQVQRSIDGFTALEEGRTTNPFALIAGAPPKK